jgi:hypothetical protein
MYETWKEARKKPVDTWERAMRDLKVFDKDWPNHLALVTMSNPLSRANLATRIWSSLISVGNSQTIRQSTRVRAQATAPASRCGMMLILRRRFSTGGSGECKRANVPLYDSTIFAMNHEHQSSVPVRSAPVQPQDYQSFGSFYTPVDWDDDGDFDLLIGSS